MIPFFCIATAFSCFADVVAQSPMPSSGAPGRWRPGLLIA
jgi:hypothetical protein